MKKEELLKEKKTTLEAVKHMEENMRSSEFAVKRLKGRVEEIDAELKKLSGRAEYEGVYFFIMMDNGKAKVKTATELRYVVDDDRFNNGNYWLREDECQKEADYTNFRLKAKKWMRENDPDFKPDWSNSRQDKYYAYYFGVSDMLEIDSVDRAHDTGMFYFSSTSIARKFRDEFADELMKGY